MSEMPQPPQSELNEDIRAQDERGSAYLKGALAGAGTLLAVGGMGIAHDAYVEHNRIQDAEAVLAQPVGSETEGEVMRFTVQDKDGHEVTFKLRNEAIARLDTHLHATHRAEVEDYAASVWHDALTPIDKFDFHAESNPHGDFGEHGKANSDKEFASALIIQLDKDGILNESDRFELSQRIKKLDERGDAANWGSVVGRLMDISARQFANGKITEGTPEAWYRYNGLTDAFPDEGDTVVIVDGKKVEDSSQYTLSDVK